MTEATLPQRIFMASDLSVRCDPAQARAALLARAWRTGLAVAHVLHAAKVARRDSPSSGAPSWRRPESWAQKMERVLRADLAAEGIAATSRVAIGSPADAVLQGAANDSASLVVLGITEDGRIASSRAARSTRWSCAGPDIRCLHGSSPPSRSHPENH